MRRGVTLIELLCTLALIGLMASVVTLSINRAPPVDNTASRIAAARHHAVESGRDTTIALDSVEATAHPDGSVVADSVFRVARLTGVIRVP